MYMRLSACNFGIYGAFSDLPDILAPSFLSVSASLPVARFKNIIVNYILTLFLLSFYFFLLWKIPFELCVFLTRRMATDMPLFAVKTRHLSTLLILRTRFHNVACLMSLRSVIAIHKQTCFFSYPPVNRLEQDFPCIFVTFWPWTIAQRFFATPAYRLLFIMPIFYFAFVFFHFYSSHGLKKRCPPISATNFCDSCHALSHNFGA